MEEQASRDGETSAFFALLALTLLVVPGVALILHEPDAPATVPPAVSVHGSTTVIRPDRTTPAGTASADLVAARNEFESFQVAIEGGAGRDNVRMSLAGDGLAGPGGARIPASDLTVYREAPYHVTFASDGEGEPGDWYDALIPERDPYYGEDRNAFPYDIAAGGKLVAWVDVLVPIDAPAGAYAGHLRVTEDGGPALARIPIRLRVLDYTMPSTSSLRSLFLSTKEDVPGEPCIAHDGFDCDPDDERGWLLHYLYSRAGLENRLTVANPSPIRTPEFDDPAQRRLFHRFVDPLLDGAVTAPPGTGLQDMRLLGAGLTTVWDGLHQDCFGPCLAGWERLLGKRIFAERFVDYLCDEPGDEAEAWAECASRAADVGSGVPLLVTSTIANAAAAGATAYVDDLVAAVNEMAPEDAGDQRPSYDDFLAAGPGRELWLYTSCDGHGCGPEGYCTSPESPSPETDGRPGYMIDEPASQARAMGWIAYEYDVDGELYYGSTWSLDTAWRNQCIFGGNGEGNLFYPGRPQGYPGSPDSAIGGTTDIPIESIRLKRIRDGREDYEYLAALESRGLGDRAREVTEGLLGDRDVAVRGATFSQDALDQARCELAELLDPSLGRCR